MGGPGPGVHRHDHESTPRRRPASLLRDGPTQLSRRRDLRAHDKDTQIAFVVLLCPSSYRPALMDRRRIDPRDKPAENSRRNRAAEEAPLGGVQMTSQLWIGGSSHSPNSCVTAARKRTTAAFRTRSLAPVRSGERTDRRPDDGVDSDEDTASSAARRDARGRGEASSSCNGGAGRPSPDGGATPAFSCAS